MELGRGSLVGPLHGDVGEHSAPPAEPPQQDTVHEELLPEEQPKPIVFKPSSGSGPLDDFFRSFHDFKYEPSAPSEAEFERLRQHRTWNPRKKTYKKQRNAFMRATRDELHWHLERDDILLPRVEEGEEGEDGDGGSDDGEGVSQQDEDALKIMEQHVKPWKRLCEVLDLRMEGGRRRPVTEEDCKEVLSDVFINIFDFIFHLRHGSGTLRRFRDVKALSDYSYNSSPIKVFPKHAALQSPVLKFLLQPIGIARTGTGKANSGADKGKGKKKEVDLDDVPELGDEQESGGVRLTTPMQLTEEALGQLEEEMAGNSKVEEMLARAVSEELAQKLE
ncbi:hypothetical protein BDZ91DRAFT_296863 [Kalaharituber pfeilii]|nr:hypothetical protein BDZ91DRAFT_296863 [Kalaharituber pfeilii]